MSFNKDDIQAFKKEISELPIREIAKAMKEMQEEISEADRALKHNKKLLDAIRLEVLPERMEEEGIETTKFTGIGRVQLQADAYVTCRADAKPMLFKWLQENGFPDLITEVVNASTLKAFVKEQVKEGNEIPGDDIINYHPFVRASIVKA